MTLHTEELTETRELESIAKKHGICYFAFNRCKDAKDSDIFYGLCNRINYEEECVLFKEYNEGIY